jgi:cytidine deaminase
LTNPAAEVSTDRPEIVVGLVGAVGTDLELTTELISEIFRTFGYHVAEPISLSRLLDNVEREEPLSKRGTAPYDDYIDKRMTAGDEFRRNLRREPALAFESIHEIVIERSKMLEERDDDLMGQPGNVAYILRSLKHEGEVEALRKVYGARFVLIGAHAPREQRTERLATDIAASYASTDRAKYKSHAERLAHRDEAEEDDDYGQHVRDTFPLADFFVDVSQRHEARDALERFIYAFFGWPYASPTRDEYAMFHAQAASARSADLSRQVGAAVATEDGDIVAVGCNEVPKFGGGAYWPGDPGDARDFQQGGDANQKMRDVIVDEIRQELAEDWFTVARKAASLADFRDALGDARVNQLTEFNRAVHAEMSALLDAARRGTSVRGATLYTTTFPCHGCAKHIVAAGITHVVYVAPYAKSLAEDLHPDSIAIDHGHDVDDKVGFDPFVGVAPDLYLPLFTKGEVRRKDPDTGKTIDFNPLIAAPKLVPQGDFAYLQRERLALGELHDAIIESHARAATGQGNKVELEDDRMTSLERLRTHPDD